MLVVVVLSEVVDSASRVFDGGCCIRNSAVVCCSCSGKTSGSENCSFLGSVSCCGICAACGGRGYGYGYGIMVLVVVIVVHKFWYER